MIVYLLGILALAAFAFFIGRCAGRQEMWNEQIAHEAKKMKERYPCKK